MQAHFQPRPRDRRHQRGPAGPRSRGFRGPRAFTLIEILACMGIFAIGFAAIAMMLPAGAVMQRDIEARGMGDIIGRNALEIVKGKGVQSLTFDATGTSIPMSEALNGGYTVQSTAGWIIGNAPRANWPTEFANRGQYDMENFYRQGYSGNWFIRGYAQDNGPDHLHKVLDTNHNRQWYTNDGVGGSCKLLMWQNPDLTHCGLGRIHALAQRPMPGLNLSMFSMLDFSYPSTLLDITQRSYFAHVMKTNSSTSAFSQNYSGSSNFWAYIYTIPSTHDWQLSVVTVHANSGDEWPEQAEQNYQAGTSEPAIKTTQASDATLNSPNCLSSNTPVYFRSRAGDSSLAGRPDSAATNHWPYWPNSGPAAAYDPTVTPYGGCPSNPCAWIRGWCIGWQGNLGGINTTIPPDRNSPCWNGFGNYITPPIADLSTPVSGRVNYKYRYPIPNLMACPVIVYDRDNDLLLVRYPQVFANVNNTNVTGNTNLQKFWADMGTTADKAPDRRLKVGDSFLCAGWTTPFKVKQLLDPVTEYKNLPAGVNKDATDAWDDGTYQIIRVTPSLSTAPYTANKPMQNRGPTMWDGPSPIMLLFAPAPLAGGPSPWVSTLQMNSCNGTVFRDWNNLTD